ncbi:MAG: hypothetical protein A3K13_05455 [Gemmatimonadetes bacterium RIFCSPLOWO2_12_FULL_68_9]|nr:MAG: hypothetical protein A3K13_05455 [Gemmatimonadetes bacterium RIFCSPLOWO2_12_FULL_68_9]
MKAAGRVYYALAVALVPGLGACVPGLESIAPSGLEPAPRDTIEAWLASYRPAGPVRYDVRWRFANQKGSTAGRAAVRIAPPDTLRFDYRGPFGRSGAAVIVADSALWVAPERDTRELLPAAPLFWDALGIPQPPPEEAVVSSREAAGGRVWRYVSQADTMDFVEVGPGPERLLTEVRRNGEIVASTEVRFRPGGRAPLEARVRFPQDGSALILTVEGVESVAAFDPSTWRRP